MAHAQSIAARLDTLLRTAEIPDYPGAINSVREAAAALSRFVEELYEA